MKHKLNFKSKLRLGLIVFGALMVIEIAEYVVGTTIKSGNWPFLGIMAIIGAWPILNYFMHIFELRRHKEQ